MACAKRYSLRLFFFIVFATFLVTPFVHASPALKITVATDKSSYIVGESVNVYANLTSDTSPVQDGLVALEVDELNQPMILRTLQTETPPTPTQVNITGVTIWDEALANQKYSFNLGEKGWILVPVKSIFPPILGDITGDNLVNLDDLEALSWAWLSENGTARYDPDADLSEDGYINLDDLEILSEWWLSEPPPPLQVFSTANMYDAEKTPILTLYSAFTLYPYSYWMTMHQFQISLDASIGAATLYACAFSDLPRNGGTSYCPEVSKGLQITGSTSSSLGEQSIYQTTATSGNYSSTFKIPTDALLGTYTVYVSSSYQGELATNSTTFQVVATP